MTMGAKFKMIGDGTELPNTESGTDACSSDWNERVWVAGVTKLTLGCLDSGQCPAADIAQPDTFTLHYNSCKPAKVSYRFEGMPGAAANWWEQEPIVAVQGSNNIHVLTFPNAATGKFFPTSENKYSVLVDGEAPNIEQDKAGLVDGNANCHSQYNEYTIKPQWEEPQDMYGCPADSQCPSFDPYVAPPATFTFTFNACYHDVVEEGDGTVGYILDDSPGDGNWYERAPIPATRGEGNTYTLTFPHESTGDYMPKMDVRYKIVVNDGESAVDVDRSAQGGHGHANCHAQYNEYTLDSSANSWVEPMDVNGCPETNTCDHLQAPVAKTGVLAGMFVGRTYHDAATQVGRKVEDATDCMAACNTINNNVAFACGYWTFDYMVRSPTTTFPLHLNAWCPPSVLSQNLQS
jgi:hypothetical protein